MQAYQQLPTAHEAALAKLCSQELVHLMVNLNKLKSR
jgi:hypothetical protein